MKRAISISFAGLLLSSRAAAIPLHEEPLSPTDTLIECIPLSEFQSCDLFLHRYAQNVTHPLLALLRKFGAVSFVIDGRFQRTYSQFSVQLDNTSYPLADKEGVQSFLIPADAGSDSIKINFATSIKKDRYNASKGFVFELREAKLVFDLSPVDIQREKLRQERTEARLHKKTYEMIALFQESFQLLERIRLQLDSDVVHAEEIRKLLNPTSSAYRLLERIALGEATVTDPATGRDIAQSPKERELLLKILNLADVLPHSGQCSGQTCAPTVDSFLTNEERLVLAKLSEFHLTSETALQIAKEQAEKGLKAERELYQLCKVTKEYLPGWTEDCL